MLSQIHNVLTKDELSQIQSLISRAQWKSGSGSAGAHARQQKNNEEMDQSCESWTTINQVVVKQLYVHPEFQSMVLPGKVSAAFVSRCKTGMFYGPHIDDPVMGASSGRYRSDVAVTVFLNEPDEYEGGELTIHSRFGPVATKLPAGSAVVYPASSLHEVCTVTRGERLVCALWCQSLVRDAHQREILHDLDEARQALAKATPDAIVTHKVDQVYVNLLRQWAEI